MIQRTSPIAAISSSSSGVSGVGEWTNSPAAVLTTVMRVGKGILGQGIPKRMAGPSTIQTSGHTGFSRLIGA